MRFGTGSTTELTQKCEGQSTKIPYVRPNINKYPQFSIELPLIVSRLLRSLANYIHVYILYIYNMLYFIVAESTCAGIWCCSVCVSSFLLHDQLEQQIHPFQPSGSFQIRWLQAHWKLYTSSIAPNRTWQNSATCRAGKLWFFSIPIDFCIEFWIALSLQFWSLLRKSF